MAGGVHFITCIAPQQPFRAVFLWGKIQVKGGKYMKVIDYAHIQTRTGRKETALSIVDALIGVLSIAIVFVMFFGIIALLS